MTEPGRPSVAQIFDSVATVYDQTGVPFFSPVGERLASLLEPGAGERSLDAGCGRGAVTLPLARAVGPDGSVDSCDLSPAMVAATRALADAAGLENVSVAVADAADLSGYDAGGYDVVAASLVVFFLADPRASLRTWVERLAPGGRIGVSTFGPLDEPTREIDALLGAYVPAGLRDPRTAGADSPFGSDAGMESLLRDAGADEVRTVVAPQLLEFAGLAAWQGFAMSTGMRAMLMNVPRPDLPALLDRIGAVLERTRDGDGPCRLEWQLRYTLGRR